MFRGKDGELSKAMKHENELHGKGSLDPKKFLGQYGNQYAGNKSSFHGSTRGGFKHKGVVGRGRGLFSKKDN